ncbi:hypothetical protein [Synechococcus phage S-N03]|uniref:Uncharacterized protein n=1 Tax=Synechococcus phage S-N03 TaxID=2718943 RepID=A0A6G8R6F8_9CAUD|nr:hypothetical protein PQC09_gp103 [Synechococcus phage S-N03]QIN96738.1 hypothetical protein [Synechococcus phage S-N03]
MGGIPPYTNKVSNLTYFTMKLFPALLAGTLFLGAAPALADANNANGNGCRNRCGGTETVYNNSGDNRGNDYSGDRNNQYGNNYGGNYGGNYGSNNTTTNNGVGENVTVQGGQGGQGGTGYGYGYGQGGDATIEEGAVNNRNTNRNNNNLNNDQRQGQAQGQQQGQAQSSNNRNTNRAEGGDVRNSGNSRNNNRTSSRSNANNRNSVNVNTGGNSYTTYGDLPEAAVAPLGQSAGRGQIGDIAVPLPTISAGGFASGSNYNDIYGAGNNNRSDYGVSIGVNIPLGAGEFRDAARREIARRDELAQAQADRNLFRLVQEAQWLQQQGLLSQEAHPRHYAALYGNK